ncbi:hypothetical protein V5799_003235 [Amblyomma americanum]|uniref:Uncharacterized protein n=1 Tax=Amblyomma americanum TaxID=6943 RepID=A0AAQ4D9J7_AMBAM
MQARCCSPHPPVQSRASGIAGAELHRCGMCMGNKRRMCKRSMHQGRCGNFATQNCPLLHACFPTTIGRAWLHYFAAVH